MGTTSPTWGMIGYLHQQVNDLEYENALKLTQILDLEQLIWDMRTPRWNDPDGSPCWCGEYDHESICIKARQATEMFWKKPKENK